MNWQTIETAPKDRPIIIIAVGYPWPTIGIWNDASEKWAYAMLQCDLFNGKWCDTYWQTEYEPSNDSKGLQNITHWMPLPATPEVK